MFEGDLEEYKKWIEKNRMSKTERTKLNMSAGDRSSLSAIKPNLSKKFLTTKQAKLEMSIASLQTELDVINNCLMDSSTYINLTQKEIRTLDQNRCILEEKIKESEEEWLELLMRIEA